MKISNILLATSLLTIANTAIGGSSTLEEFPYEYLGANQIDLCPGIVPNVITVRDVGATRSGGCCGSDEIWNEKRRINGGIFQFPPPPIRAQIQNFVRHYKFKSLSLGKNFVKSVDPVISLMEQTGIRNSKINACISKFNLVDINQSKARGTQVKFDIAYKLFLNMDSEVQKNILVQEVGGQTLATSKFYHLYYDFNPRPAGFIVNSWPLIQGNFDKFLTQIPNEEADRNLENLKIELGL